MANASKGGSSARSSKKKRQQKQQNDSTSTPRLSFPALNSRAATAAPATVSTVTSDAILSADRNHDGAGKLPASASAASIASNTSVSASLNHLIAQERDSRTRTSSNASSSHRVPSHPPHLLSTIAGPASSPAQTLLSVSPPSPKKHSQDAESSFASLGAADAGDLSNSSNVPGLAVPLLLGAPTAAGRSKGGALGSLRRVASRDKLQKEQAEQAASRKSAKKHKRKDPLSQVGNNSSPVSAAASDIDRNSIRSTGGSLAAQSQSPAQKELLEQSQFSAHAEADRMIEADQAEAAYLEAHVLKHQGDQRPPVPGAASEKETTRDLSAAFIPTYQTRTRKHKIGTLSTVPPSSPNPTKHTQSGSASSSHSPVERAAPSVVSTRGPAAADQSDPDAAQRTHRGWHAQMEADRQRIGAAVGDMVLSSSRDGQHGTAPSWRTWERVNRSAEVSSLFSAGVAGPQIGLVWHGPGLALPGKLRATVSTGVARVAKLLRRSDDAKSSSAGDSDSARQEQQKQNRPGPVELVRMRSPLPLLVPHSVVEWATSALGAGVGMQILRWALGANA